MLLLSVSFSDCVPLESLRDISCAVLGHTDGRKTLFK